MRLIRLALALVAVSSSWAALANPAINSNVSGAIAGTVGAAVVGTTTATQLVAGQRQARLDGGLGVSHRPGHDVRSNARSSLVETRLAGSSLSGSAQRTVGAVSMDESMPRGWLMALVTVLLIGHQLRRKHRFLRPHRFSDL